MRLLQLCALAACAAACAKSIEGPTPVIVSTVNEVDAAHAPATVCNAQGDAALGWLVDATGDHYSPLPVSTLSGAPGLLLPSAVLTGPETYALPADRVHFVDQTRLPLALPTRDTTAPHQLQPGSYALTLTNPNGNTGTLAAALTVVPPPAIASVQVLDSSGVPGPPTVCSDTAQTLVITGTGFRTDVAPKVSFVGATTVPGQPVATPYSSTQLKVQLPAGAFSAAQSSAAGTVYTVKVSNIDGCSAPYGQDPRGFGVTDIKVFPTCTRLGTLAVAPRFGWQYQNQPVTVTNQFAQPATQPFSGAAPQIFIRAPLRGSTTLQSIPLRRVAFSDPNTVTAVVPTCSGPAATPTSGTPPSGCAGGIAPGGPYDLTVNDPVSGSGSIAGGFTVTADQPPQISAINPTSISTAGVSPLVIAGAHFSSGTPAQAATAYLGTQVQGGVEYCPLAAHAGGVSSDIELDADVPNSLGPTGCYVEDASGNRTAAAAGFSLAVGLYLVRVQHGADLAAVDFSGLVVTLSSFNPVTGPAIATKLAEPLYDFPLVQASDDIDNHFLYALGGTSSSGAVAHVEVAPLTPFGDVGGTCDAAGNCTFRLLDRTGAANAHQGQLGVRVVSNALTAPTPRTGTTAVVRQAAEACGASTCTTSYLYVIGGAEAGASVAKVERAQVLRAADAPVLNDTAAVGTGSLAAGTYAYRVSALRPLSDTRNPGGETLASDTVSVTSVAGGSATLTWSCVSGAAGYRIYRTVTANASSASQRFLASAPACSSGTASYTDTGATAPAASGDAPLTAGALGTFVSLAPLSVARTQAKAIVSGDDLWVVGGSCTAGSSGCTAAGDLASVEHIAFTAGSADFASGPWSASGTLAFARSQHSLVAITKADAPTTVASGTVLLLAVGGTNAGALVGTNGTVVSSSGLFLEEGTLGANGTTTWTAPTYSPSGIGMAGGWAEVQADNLFLEGTNGAAPFSTLFNRATSGGICSTGCSTSTPVLRFGINSPGGSYAGYQLPTPGFPRWLVGETLFRAYIYAAGGALNSTGASPTDTLERLVY